MDHNFYNKTKVPCYTMKLRIYPNNRQKKCLREILHALHVIYNMTFHEVFLQNPEVCTDPGEDGTVWPDYHKMAKASWRKKMVEKNPIIEKAPAESITSNLGIFMNDAQIAWKAGMHNRPVSEKNRKDFTFYSKNKTRKSFTVQIPVKSIITSETNGKTCWLKIPKVAGNVKARGFNRKIWFGENADLTFEEALRVDAIKEKVTLQVTEDSCGDFFATIKFSSGKKESYSVYRETNIPLDCREPVGIDVGIKDIAILSNGAKIENRKFKKQKENKEKYYNKKLSRGWGYANAGFRDFCKAARVSGSNMSGTSPSNNYLRVKQKRAKLERKIARQRDTYYHQQTAKIVSGSSMIAVETLRVKNMMKNHRLAFALSDVAISSFTEKLKYKAEREGIPIRYIGMFQPSSQRCSTCGFINPAVKKLSVRSWFCPSCGTHHDRDINAAKNILFYASKSGVKEDKKLKDTESNVKKKPEKKKRKENLVSENYPDLFIAYSKELSRINNPRYVIKNRKTKKIEDDAQGYGYRSVTNARNAFKAKHKYSAKFCQIAG